MSQPQEHLGAEGFRHKERQVLIKPEADEATCLELEHWGRELHDRSHGGLVSHDMASWVLIRRLDVISLWKEDMEVFSTEKQLNLYSLRDGPGCCLRDGFSQQGRI